MKAVIMAGGEGTRLRPLTSMRPKPMVPIVNQPVMEHIIGLVKHHGMDEVVATLMFMPQVIEDYFGDGDEWGVKISYAIEESPLGTAGSVKNAEEALTEPFLVISGDALTDIDLREVIDFHNSHDGPVTIALKRVPDPLEFGVVITDESGRIQRFLEKPSWGQVFSDTINTGIYVLDPMIFEHIPSDEPYDFSSQLFPDLMEKGFPLYGCVVEGYWCDVGSLDSYMQVHKDILDGNAMIYVPGAKARNDVWVGKGADVDPGAHIGNKVVIGANTKVRRGAVLGDYTIIGDNCLVGYDADLGHSIIWSDSFIGAGSELKGTVVCRRADIRARAKLLPGSTIGDETMVGHAAVVGNDVQVYPYKRIESGATVTSSLIWENTALRSLFGADGVSGLVNIDITPELALRVAQAFGSILPNLAHVVVSRDSSRAARMMKRALVAGLNSAGTNVRDLRVASPAITRFTTRDTRCLGGVHVAASPEDPQSLEIHFYDRDGIELAPWVEKKVERLYFRQEFRRSFFDEVGEIMYPPRALEYYTAGLNEALLHDGPICKKCTVVVDMGLSAASFVLPVAGATWGIEVIALRPFIDTEKTRVASVERDAHMGQLVRTVDMFQADMGLSMDANAERVTLVTPRGVTLDNDTALHALVWLWCETDKSSAGIAVPLTASRVIERIAEKTGRTVIRTGTSRRALSNAAHSESVGFAGSRNGGFIFPRFLIAPDALMTLGMLVRMLTELDTDLDAVVEALPEFYLRHVPVHCPFDKKGAVMRRMAALGETHEVEMTEGVRVLEPHGWALVLPHASDSIVNVYVEGDSDAAADALAEQYSEFVRQASDEE
ncbi:MAG: NTP transferase domain-containing protein [Coriobacteriia bacterium]|nr:NTP transferase domain-containing protein [Coriobacteriia bacterium]